jgi:hypothetical protein
MRTCVCLDVQNKGQSRKKPLTFARRRDSCRSNDMICSDWSITLKSLLGIKRTIAESAEQSKRVTDIECDIE